MNFKGMSTGNLKKIVKKIDREQAHKREHGDYGTGRYVAETEFWRGNIGSLRAEAKRRGIAVKPRKRRSRSQDIFGGFGGGWG